jgi:protein-S-isoprenylcysteine O-methyltransferase Ste14
MTLAAAWPAAIVNRVTHSQVHALALVGVATCWGVIVVVWVAGALYNVARGTRARRRGPLVSNLSAGLVVAALVWATFKIFPAPDWHSLVVGTAWVRVLGLAILSCATAFTFWARVALGTMWSASPTVKAQHQLRTDGPYGVTRHPIYTGLLGMLLGTALLVGLGHWLVLVPVGLLVIEIRIHVEEGLMLATFPEPYRRYRRRVPQLVPGLRRLRREPTG